MDDMIIWSPGVTLDQIEEQVIKKAFSYFKQNKVATSNALGISPRTLDSKLDRYGENDEQIKKRMDLRRRKDANFLARCRGESHLPYPPEDLEDELPKEQFVEAKNLPYPPEDLEDELPKEQFVEAKKRRG